MEQLINNELIGKLVVALVAGLTGGIVTAFGVVGRALMKHGALETTIDSNNKSIVELERHREDHATRIALLEKAVFVLESVAPAVKEISIVSSKLDALMEQNMRRLDLLERAVFHHKSEKPYDEHR